MKAISGPAIPVCNDRQEVRYVVGIIPVGDDLQEIHDIRDTVAGVIPLATVVGNLDGQHERQLLRGRSLEVLVADMDIKILNQRSRLEAIGVHEEGKRHR